MDIRQTNIPLETQGGTWGVLGGQQFKSLGRLSDWHQLRFTSPDSSGKDIVAPQYPRWHFGGWVRVSQIQKCGEAVKRLDRLAPNLAHICRFIWEWIYAKEIAPRDTRGHLVGYRGQTFKSLPSMFTSPLQSALLSTK